MNKIAPDPVFCRERFLVKTALLLCVLVISACTKQTDPYEVLLSGNDAEVRGWIHPWDRIGELPMLTGDKGREYGIENLPKELEECSVQIRANAKYSKMVSSPGYLNTLVIRLNNIRPGRQDIERWDDVLTAQYSDPSKFTAVLKALKDEIGIPLPFWPPAQAEPTAEVVGFSMSGCGYLYKKFVKMIPKSRQKDSLASDDVFELDEKGQIVRRWFIPGNDIVYGIQSDRLLVGAPTSTLFRRASLQVDQGASLFLAIAPGGDFRVVEIKSQLEEPVAMSCPTIKDFEGSAYTLCGVFKDLQTGQPRRLAYQGPCT